MNDERPTESATEWPVAAVADRDPALAALEAAWRAGALAENEPTA